MTLAMLLVLISHHKGLTLLLIVIIALLFIALTPLVKKLLSHLHDRSLIFFYDRLQGAFSSSSPFIPPPAPPAYSLWQRQKKK